MVTQFVPHCHHFAGRGAVAITFEYRTATRNNTGPLEAMEDAKAALQWIQRNAVTFGIDPHNTVVAGAAGGAFLALHLAMQKPSKDPGAVIRPVAAIVFSSLLNTTPKGQLAGRFPDNRSAKANSPTSLLRRKLPPLLMLHGKSDRVTPFEEASAFHRRMRWRGNRCELLEFNGAEHSFFNFNVSQPNFEMTISAADAFLVKHGVLEDGRGESPES